MSIIRKLYRKWFVRLPKRPDNGLVGMPKDWIGQVHNACTDPCDMICGPCVCGAWHHFDEWTITRKKLTAKGWV